MTNTTTPPPAKPRRNDAARLPMRWAMKSRSREGELYRRICRDLRQHVGGSPSAAQEMLIGRIAWISVYLARFDERAMETGDLSDHASRQYLAWANALSRMLQALGLAAPAAPERTVEQLLVAARNGGSR